MAAVIMYGIFFIGCLGGYFYLKGQASVWRYTKYLPVASLICLICFLVGIWDFAGQKNSQLSYLNRNQVGEGAREEQLMLDAGEILSQYTYPVTVEEKLLTDAEIRLLFEEGKQELEQVILGKNASLEEVTTNLNIPTTLMEGRVEVDCYLSPYKLVDANGTIQWQNFSKETEILKVSAQMYCQDMEATHEFYLRLVSPPLSETGALLKEIGNQIQKENGTNGQEVLKLPETVNGVPLKWHQLKGKNHLKVLVFGVMGLVLWYVYEKEKAEREQKEWKQGLIRDYPDIVSQLSLLSGAGMTIPAAWEKIALEYRSGKESGRIGLRPGYEEMLKTWHEIRDGVGEIKAYENFGRRCSQSSYRKFASILVQNVRKGTKGMQQLLDAEAMEAFHLRKTYAKQMGEEAGTKLLIPMGLMLLLVFAILMLPAMLSLNI